MAAVSPAAGLSPAETAFLAEMEQVTVLPRQVLPTISLLAGPTAALQPPLRAQLPLWFALLLRKQGRANIVPPPWLSVAALDSILAYENAMPGFSPPPAFGAGAKGAARGAAAGPPYAGPPFQPSATADASRDTLPYHWLEISQLMLNGAADDVPEADTVRRLLRDLREARAAKMRKRALDLEGTRHVVLRGVGGMEVCEQRAFVTGVVDGLRKIGASKEAARREREENDEESDDDDDDDDML